MKLLISCKIKPNANRSNPNFDQKECFLYSFLFSSLDEVMITSPPSLVNNGVIP